MTKMMAIMALLFTTASARMITAPSSQNANVSSRLDVVTFVKYCDTMKISFMEYKKNVAYCSTMDWNGNNDAFSSDMPTDENPSLYFSDTIDYLNISFSYTDTYVVLQNQDTIIINDDFEYVNTLKNAIKNNTDPDSYCRDIDDNYGGQVYKLKQGTTNINVCGTNIVPPSPPPSPPSGASTNVASITMFFATIVGIFMFS